MGSYLGPIRASHTYEMVRWWGLLWALLGTEPTTKRKSLQKLFGIYWLWRGYELPDWPKFDAIRDFDVQGALSALPDEALRSFPQWFEELASNQLGNQWPQIGAALNVQNSVNLRVNHLKSNTTDVCNALRDSGLTVEHHPIFNEALVLAGRPRLNNIEAFKQGWFEVQDAGSQAISAFMAPTPGSTVIDACAGAGGKTLHIASLMQNRGEIIAMDVEGRKLGELQKRCTRAGASIVRTRAWEEKGVLGELEASADFLLMDVPCSGTGVIKREPDTKWKLQREHLDRITGIQQHIIHSYTSMVKPGGMAVYATCSILPMENQQQVEAFLKGNEDWTLIEERSVLPGEHNDGFYMAKMQRKA